MVYKHIKSTRDLPKSFMKELLFFFISYNEEKGKEFRVLEVVSREKAKNILKENFKNTP
jgi:inorganic pyrophosphatase